MYLAHIGGVGVSQWALVFITTTSVENVGIVSTSQQWPVQSRRTDRTVNFAGLRWNRIRMGGALQ